jgi:Zn-dependent protease with chaperone function
VNSAATLLLVLLAVYGVAVVGLAAMLLVAQRTSRFLRVTAANDLFVVRVMPVAGAVLLTLAIALPAFLTYEPRVADEPVGPIVIVFAGLAVTMLGDALRRALRARAAARAFVSHCGLVGNEVPASRRDVQIVETVEPIAAVIGLARPRIVAARRVLDACSADEFHEVVAHESAHMAARDNLKMLLLVATPDPLAWLPAGLRLVRRWRAAAEFEADDRATGADPLRRLSLASALIKVARMAAPNSVPYPSIAMRVAEDDVPGRVRRLMSPPEAPRRSLLAIRLVCVALLAPILAVPLYAPIHEIIESIVTFGR